jgi:glycosyltransferase involved in cell wall biosynthesis
VDKIPEKILFYTDSVVFGGHEITLLEAITGLVAEPDVHVVLMLPQQNERFLQKLQPIEGKLSLCLHQFATEVGDVFRVLFNSRKVKKLRQKILEHQPTLVIVSQGAIGLSACGLGAVRSSGIPLVSFLPMAHAVEVTRGEKTIGTWLQNLVYNKLYQLPDYFITICRTTAKQLMFQHGVAAECIFVHYFGLQVNKIPPTLLQLKKAPKEVRHLALIGRIEFYQKRHDFFMQQLASSIGDLPPMVVHIIGDGPDKQRLIELVRKLGLQHIVRFEGWIDDLSDWYKKKLDLVLLPSRFEGVPVVMIEAMYWGVPVLASRVDGMKEILPSEWLFPVHNAKKMMEVLGTILEQDQDILLAGNQQLVFDKLNIDVFRTGFSHSVLSCLSKKGHV